MRKIVVIALILIICASCKQTYYYSDDSNKSDTIKAENDSVAYMQAYMIFSISGKVYDDFSKKFGKDAVKKPTKFILLNSKRQDITNTVIFDGKLKLEDSIRNKIWSRESVFKKDSSEVTRAGILSKSDTAGVYKSPVKILSAKFVKKEYSNYRDVRLSYKNTSSKAISAIRFRWYGVNAFNEPADMGGLVDGTGGGFTEDKLLPGASDYGVWSILSKDGKTITAAFAYEVMFSDGTKWELSDD